MKNVINIFFVILVFLFFSCNNEKDGIVSVNDDNLDGINTSYGLRMVVTQDDGGEETIIAEESIGIYGYALGTWFDFWTLSGSNSVFRVYCYLDWDAGSSIYEGGLYEIAPYNGGSNVFSQFLAGNSNEPGSSYQSYYASLNPSTHYKYRMSTVLITEDSK